MERPVSTYLHHHIYLIVHVCMCFCEYIHVQICTGNCYDHPGTGTCNSDQVTLFTSCGQLHRQALNHHHSIRFLYATRSESGRSETEILGLVWLGHLPWDIFNLRSYKAALARLRYSCLLQMGLDRKSSSEHAQFGTDLHVTSCAKLRQSQGYFNTNPIHVLMAQHLPELGLQQTTWYEAPGGHHLSIFSQAILTYLY